MLRVNLLELDREGSLRITRDIAPDSPIWEDVERECSGPARVELTVQATPTGQVLARGTLHATLERRCRRCLVPVEDQVHQELNLVWVPRDDLIDEKVGEVEGGDGVRTLELANNELELGPAIREELILAIEPFVVCREDCQGLCPKCGINRNNETCDCTLDEPDPRWDALRALKED